MDKPIKNVSSGRYLNFLYYRMNTLLNCKRISIPPGTIDEKTVRSGKIVTGIQN